MSTTPSKMKRINFFTILGTGLFFSGILILVSLNSNSTQSFTIKDDTKDFIEKPCDHVLEDFTSKNDRDVVINQSFNFMVNLKNNSSYSCDVTVDIYATTFEVKGFKDKITLPPFGEASLGWNLNPLKEGQQEIAVSANHDTGYVTFNVVNSAWEKLKNVFSIIAAFLGSALTLPFWISFYEKRRKKKK